LAGLLNACKITKKKFNNITIVISGAGAAGYAITKLLRYVCINKKIYKQLKNILVCDTKGIIYQGRNDLLHNKYKQRIAKWTNRDNIKGTLKDALKGADIFIGVSAPNIVTAKMIKSMNKNPIVFALSNPVPEINPRVAKKAGAVIVATGRSDFPNQINNVLAFPGIFKGALDARATKINEEMKIAAMCALANYIKKLTPEKIIPNILDKNVTKKIAQAVKKEAMKCGCARVEKPI
jgi:malate dehydrogenase (oxaloacetate-decarboxylating)